MDPINYSNLPPPDAVSIGASDKDSPKSYYVLHYDWGNNKHQQNLPITLDTSQLLIYFIAGGAKVDPDVRLAIAASIPGLKEATERLMKKPKDQLAPEEISVILDKFNLDGEEFPAVHRN